MEDVGSEERISIEGRELASEFDGVGECLKEYWVVLAVEKIGSLHSYH